MGLQNSRLHACYTPFTQGLRPLCLPCATTKPAMSPLKAQRRPKGCLGRSRVAQRTLRPRHCRHGRRKVLSMFKTVAQRSPRGSVTHRSVKGTGGRQRHRHGRRMDVQGSVIGRLVKMRSCYKDCISIWTKPLPPLYHHCAPFGRAIASIERPLWQPLCFHSATTTSLEPPWRWFCLHSASFARPVFPLHQFWWLKEGTGVVLQQLHRNRAFWVWATTERPGQFSGHSKVARRSQSCAKGVWELVVHLF